MSEYYYPRFPGGIGLPSMPKSPGGGGGTPSYYIQDYRNYTVSASLAVGTMKITSANHPTSVTVNQKASWSLSAAAEGGYVDNPGIAYQYLNGPSTSVTLVQNNGSTVSVPAGGAAVLYLKGNQPSGTAIYSSPVFSGVIFPEAGTYTIQLLAGYLSDTAASEGTYSGFANLYILVTSSLAIQSVGAPSPYSVGAGMPLTITTQAGVWDIVDLVGALSPFLVVGGAIFANEVGRYK